MGYNYDTTVADRAVATRPHGTSNPGAGRRDHRLVDLGDRRGHRHHGLWGALLIEPRATTWLNPNGGGPLNAGANQGLWGLFRVLDTPEPSLTAAGPAVARRGRAAAAPVAAVRPAPVSGRPGGGTG